MGWSGVGSDLVRQGRREDLIRWVGSFFLY